MAYKYVNDNGLKAYTKKVKGALKDLHTPIAISTMNSTESKAQNVKNIEDFIAKAKATGIADVNGMAVTCLLSSGYSGVGYLHFVDGNYTLRGVEIQEELDRSNCFLVWEDGGYSKTMLITGEVTSRELAKGARKPIILTLETTEVDEVTYERLLSDDVDAVFKTSNGNLCGLVDKTENDDNFEFVFSCFSVEGKTDVDVYIYGYDVSITKNSPHTCSITENVNNDFSVFLDNSGYLNKSTLSPVLQEIDLTGTDAERKARLAQFETDWKALTGASDMIGARFVGKVKIDTLGRTCTGIFVYGDNFGQQYPSYSSLVIREESTILIATTTKVNGTLTITPLVTKSYVDNVLTLANAVKAFGAIELKASDNAANKAALKAYLKILTDAGVSTTNGYSVPVRITGNAQEYHGMLNIGTGALLSGIVTDVNENHHYPFNVSTADGAITFDANNYFLEKTSNEVTEMLDAIKYSYTPVPLTATTLSNRAQLEVFLSKVPTAQVMHCTYKDVYAGTLHKINGDWFGLLVKNTNNYEDALQVKLQADGTLIEGTTSLAQVNAKLDTIIG